MLNNVIEIKKIIMKWLELIWVNLSNIWSELWNKDNFIEKKQKKITKSNF
jgi:hypothetical protein